MKTLLAALILCGLAVSQTVVPISSEDAEKVKSVHEQMVKAEKDWEDLQKQIGEKYLIVAKDSPDAGERDWYPSSSGIWGATSITSGDLIMVGSDGTMRAYDPQCETAEEKMIRLSKEAERKNQEEKARQEREATAKKIHKGFDSESDFIFSDDYKFLLQKPEKASPPSNVVPVVNWIN